LLLLFDIDGTLVHSRPLTHQRALEQAAHEVFGLEIPPGATPVQDVEPWGKTDRQILREVLRAAGLPEPTAEQVPAWEQRACAAYERLETEGEDLSATAAALARLQSAGHTLALVTGNLEPIARRKLALRGLEGFFERGLGGFGSDADLRPELVRIARARAADHPRDDTVLIGDTPNDVAAALADDIPAIGITGPRFNSRALLEAGAAATIDEIPELEPLLAHVSSGRSLGINQPWY
jgi:phosphoglycolate phosphatase